MFDQAVTNIVSSLLLYYYKMTKCNAFTLIQVTVLVDGTAITEPA